jgi:hypothetical protein
MPVVGRLVLCDVLHERSTDLGRQRAIRPVGSTFERAAQLTWHLRGDDALRRGVVSSRSHLAERRACPKRSF